MNENYACSFYIFNYQLMIDVTGDTSVSTYIYFFIYHPSLADVTTAFRKRPHPNGFIF